MVLDGECAFIAMGEIICNGVGAYPVSAALELDIILDEDTILEDCEACLAVNFAIFEGGAMEDNVIGLPFAGFFAGINERRISAIKSAALAVGVGFIVIIIEDLDFVNFHEEDTGVAAALGIADYFFGSREFEVQLA